MVVPLLMADMSNYILPIILFLAAQTVTFITVCVNIYTRVMVRLREMEVRITRVEANEREMFDKLDELLRTTHRIEIEVSNKKDREK